MSINIRHNNLIFFSNDIHFNFEIQWLSIDALCSIGDLDTLQIVTNFITSRIDTTFKNKLRYHGNSQMHRTLQTSLQHILILILKGIDVGNILNWCFNLLVKLPHQPSVRICLDWIISLHFYMQVSLYYTSRAPLSANVKFLLLL